MRPILVLLTGLAVVAGSANLADAAPILSFDTDVSEWDSSTAAAPPTIFPIGGSGQLNGGFVVSEDSVLGAQIGIRAQERFVGPVLSQSNDGSKATYVASNGESAPGESIWNWDFHIDLRGITNPGTSAPLELSDYDATFTVTDVNGVVESIDLNTVLSGALSAARLLQTSQNPGFASQLPSVFDPFATGIYNFVLTLTPVTFTGDTLVAEMDVLVTPEPTGLTLAVLGALGLAGIGWQRRRKPATS